MCVQFVCSEFSSVFTRVVQVWKKIKELAKKIHLKVNQRFCCWSLLNFQISLTLCRRKTFDAFSEWKRRFQISPHVDGVLIEVKHIFNAPLGTQHITDLLRRLCEKHHRTLGLVWLPWSGQRDGYVLEHSAVTLGLPTCLVGLFPAGYLCCRPSQTASPFLKQWLRVMNSAVRNTNVDDKRLIKKQFRLSVVSLGTKQSQWPYTANVNKTTNQWQHKANSRFNFKANIDRNCSMIKRSF